MPRPIQFSVLATYLGCFVRGPHTCFVVVVVVCLFAGGGVKKGIYQKDVPFNVMQ